MGRRRKAWLVAGNGILVQHGRRLPGYYARYSEYAPGGRRINRSRHFLSRHAAATWVRQYNARLDLQQVDEVVPISLRDAHEEFSRATVSLADSTRTHYDSAIGMFLATVGDVLVCDVRGGHIDQFIASRRQYSGGATVAKHLRSLHRFFAWACARERRYAVHNPVNAATTRPRASLSVGEKPVVTEAQLRRLYVALDTAHRRLAMLLAITTGLDRGVLTRLCTAQIDLEQRLIHFRRPKSGKVMAVPIHPRLVRSLADTLVPAAPLQPVLCGLARQRRDRDWWAQATASAGVPDLKFRHLRALATARLQRLGGASLRDAQALLGHSSIQTTARHYHMPDPALVAALARTPLPGAPTPATRPKRKLAGAPDAADHVAV